MKQKIDINIIITTIIFIVIVVIIYKAMTKKNAVKTAKLLLKQFDEIKEDDPRLKDHLYTIWRHVGYSDSSAKKAIQNKTAWSAAYISYLFRNYSDFKKSASHSVYTVDARNNTQQNKGRFKLRRPEEYKPKVGDIILKNRGGNNFTYDTIYTGAPSHGDIVISRKLNHLVTNGGNVQNEIETTNVDTIGGFVNDSKIFAIIENQYPLEFSYTGEQAIKIGAIGSNVKMLQNRLNSIAKNNMILTIIPDGIFGNKTEKLLERITGKNQIKPSEFNTHFDEEFTEKQCLLCGKSI